jgi:hypothetical protein
VFARFNVHLVFILKQKLYSIYFNLVCVWSSIHAAMQGTASCTPCVHRPVEERRKLSHFRDQQALIYIKSLWPGSRTLLDIGFSCPCFMRNAWSSVRTNHDSWWPYGEEPPDCVPPAHRDHAGGAARSGRSLPVLPTAADVCAAIPTVADIRAVPTPAGVRATIHADGQVPQGAETAGMRGRAQRDRSARSAARCRRVWLTSTPRSTSAPTSRPWRSLSASCYPSPSSTVSAA